MPKGRVNNDDVMDIQALRLPDKNEQKALFRVVGKAACAMQTEEDATLLAKECMSYVQTLPSWSVTVTQDKNLVIVEGTYQVRGASSWIFRSLLEGRCKILGLTPIPVAKIGPKYADRTGYFLTRNEERIRLSEGKS